jgi:hypothetical protein
VQVNEMDKGPNNGETRAGTSAPLKLSNAYDEFSFTSNFKRNPNGHCSSSMSRSASSPTTTSTLLKPPPGLKCPLPGDEKIESLQDELTILKSELEASKRTASIALSENEQLLSSLQESQRELQRVKILLDEASKTNQQEKKNSVNLAKTVNRLRADVHERDKQLELVKAFHPDSETKPTSVTGSYHSISSTSSTLSIRDIPSHNQPIANLYHAHTNSNRNELVSFVSPEELNEIVESLTRDFSKKMESQRVQFQSELDHSIKIGNQHELDKQFLQNELDQLRDRLSKGYSKQKELLNRENGIPHRLCEATALELETYQLHVDHLKSLLAKNLSSTNYSETVTNLSLKLSYTHILKEIYEETIDELLHLAKLNVELPP